MEKYWPEWLLLLLCLSALGGLCGCAVCAGTEAWGQATSVMLATLEAAVTHVTLCCGQLVALARTLVQQHLDGPSTPAANREIDLLIWLASGGLVEGE